MSKGRFIVFEGADGSGTSTQTRLMLKRLDDMYNKSEKTSRHISTFEPSNGPIGKLARQVIEKKVDMNSRSLEKLFRSDRIDHVHREIGPAIEEGVDVLCDRYYVSTLVYQSIRDTMSESVAVLWKLLRDMFYSESCDIILHPDVILLIGVDMDEAKKRRTKRDGIFELFDDAPFQEKVVRLYRYWLDNVPTVDCRSKKVHIDGNQSQLDVAEDCWSAVKYLFKQNRVD